MKRNLIPIVFLFLLLSISCKQKAPVVQTPQSQFSVQLTEEEKKGGLMTPEIMWKFSRLGTFTLSPDGKNVLYTYSQIDLQTEARRTNIFKVPVSGGEAVQLTTEGGSTPQWISDGKRIVFVQKGNLCSMNPDGSDKTVITGLDDFEIFNISPSGDRIYFTRRVKLDQTANEKYNLPKAKVRIINDLMYRHWNVWNDFSYSHIFVLVKKILWKDKGLRHQPHQTTMTEKFHGAPMANR
jgi:dipeptidyl aminopeptidase/acylaminoacyl peptidase